MTTPGHTHKNTRSTKHREECQLSKGERVQWTSSLRFVYECRLVLDSNPEVKQNEKLDRNRIRLSAGRYTNPLYLRNEHMTTAITVTIEQIMALFFSGGVHVNDLDLAFTFRQGLMDLGIPSVRATEQAQKQDGADINNPEAAVKPARKGLLRTAANVSNLVKVAHKRPGPLPGSGGKRQAFIEALAVGGTMQEISKRVGVSDTYGWPILKALKNQGRVVSKTRVEGVPNRQFFLKLQG